jgi:hypothetical protein
MPGACPHESAADQLRHQERWRRKSDPIRVKARRETAGSNPATSDEDIFQLLHGVAHRLAHRLSASGVGAMRLPSRTNSSSPVTRRSLASAELTAGWLSPSRSPALVVLSSVIIGIEDLEEVEIECGEIHHAV